MICKVITAIERFSMFSNGTVTVGLSGGADSVALLHILCELRSKYSISLSAAHVNHCLRGDESQRDEQFVRELCERLSVPLSVKRIDVGLLAKEAHIGLEECGRNVRYEFFDSLETDVIATAHTLSDSVETMLINLSRGCSLSGLCSIPPVRGKIVRPLILCTGDEVRQYCKDNGIEYVTDSSNLADEYMRNRVRHSVLPSLTCVAPAFINNAGRCIDSIREDNVLLDSMAERLLEQALCTDAYSSETLLSAPAPLSRRALYSLLYKESGVMPERKHLDILLDTLASGGTVQLCGGLICSCENGLLKFPKGEKADEAWSINAVIGKNVTAYSNITLMKVGRLFYESLSKRERTESCFDSEKVEKDIVLRSRLPGDKLSNPHRGNTKTLKKLFTEAKLPKSERNKTAVLSDSHGVIWVEGFCVDKRCAVDENTKEIIYVKSERK